MTLTPTTSKGRRTLTVLAAAGTVGLALTACSGESTPKAEPGNPKAINAAACAATGGPTDRVKFEGDAWSAPTSVSVPADLTSDGLYVSNASGPTASDDTYFEVNMSIYEPGKAASDATAPYAPFSQYSNGVGKNFKLGNKLLPDWLRQALRCSPENGRMTVVLSPSVLGSAAAPASDQGPIVLLVDAKRVPEDQVVLADAVDIDAAEVKAGDATMPQVSDNGENASPTLTFPGTGAPAKTTYEVLKKGGGAAVKPGQTVKVKYKGVVWGSNEPFDENWKKETAPSFATNQVVKGFGYALEHAHVGDQILVAMPAADGYGDQATGKIPAGSNLVFVIEVLEAE